MNGCIRLVTIVASLVLGANAYGETTGMGAPRVPFGVACEVPGGEFMVLAGLAPASTVLCGEITEQGFDRFVFVLGFCLFFAWIVGGIKSARLVAIPTGACLAVLVQILFLNADAEDWGDAGTGNEKVGDYLST